MDNLEKIFFESYEAHSDEIFRFILFKLDNREKAKDILQDVFMKTWLYMLKENKIGNMRAFLYKTAGNAVVDEYRRQSRRDSKLESLEALSEAGFNPSFDDADAVINRLDGEQAMEMVKKMPSAYAEVLFLRYSEGLGIGEIAEITGQTNNAVSVQLSRGIKKLRDMMLDKYKNQP